MPEKLFFLHRDGTFGLHSLTARSCEDLRLQDSSLDFLTALKFDRHLSGSANEMPFNLRVIQ